MPSPKREDLTPGQQDLRDRHGYCMARIKGNYGEAHETPITVTHDCFQSVDHKGNHRCAEGCNFEWENP
jgi:hypothetical protein